MAGKYLIDPMGAVRLNYSDRWSKRPVAVKYYAYKNKLKELNLTLNNNSHIIFNIKMAKSWSLKDKHKYNGEPHQNRPDIDNLVKGLLDAVFEEDKHIWKISAEKRWANVGSIEIINKE